MKNNRPTNRRTNDEDSMSFRGGTEKLKWHENVILINLKKKNLWCRIYTKNTIEKKNKIKKKKNTKKKKTKTKQNKHQLLRLRQGRKSDNSSKGQQLSAKLRVRDRETRPQRLNFSVTSPRYCHRPIQF